MTLKQWLKRYGVMTGCLVSGVVLLLFALQPFFSFLILRFASTESKLIAPVPAAALTLENTAFAPQIIDDLASLKNPQPEILDDSLYFADLTHWFTGSEQMTFNRLEKQYSIDIPKLNIKNALVKMGGTDLDNNLIQYATTPLPGEKGAPVIFGHSILRQFYDPREKNPRRYMSIFSTIMTLQKGDKIYITSDGVRYTYEVMYNKQVEPDDDYILAQDDGDKFLKLVTCTPEGTYLMRGVVTARLVYE